MRSGQKPRAVGLPSREQGNFPVRFLTHNYSSVTRRTCWLIAASCDGEVLNFLLNRARFPVLQIHVLELTTGPGHCVAGPPGGETRTSVLQWHCAVLCRAATDSALCSLQRNKPNIQERWLPSLQVWVTYRSPQDPPLYPKMSWQRKLYRPESEVGVRRQNRANHPGGPSSSLACAWPGRRESSIFYVCSTCTPRVRLADSPKGFLVLRQHIKGRLYLPLNLQLILLFPETQSKWKRIILYLLASCRRETNFEKVPTMWNTFLSSAPSTGAMGRLQGGRALSVTLSDSCCSSCSWGWPSSSVSLCSSVRSRGGDCGVGHRAGYLS